MALRKPHQKKNFSKKHPMRNETDVRYRGIARRTERSIASAFSKYSEWNSQAMGMCCAIFGFIVWIVAMIWHAGLGQPTLAELIYPWFTLANPAIAAGTLIVFVALGYISGYLWARIYNYLLGKF